MDAREYVPHAGDDPAEGTLDELETEVVEDLGVDEDASDVIGGPAMTTGGCPVRQ